MSTVVSNVSGDRNDKIANAAKVLGKSNMRKRVFIAVYTNKRKAKTVADIMSLSKISSNVRVLQEVQKLVAEDIVKLNRGKGIVTTYEKIDFYTHNKARILQLVESPQKLEKFPTKINPAITSSPSIRLVLPKNKVSYKEVTIDDIKSFEKVKKVKVADSTFKQIAESKLKSGFQKIIGEKGKFTDWGGEINDLFTSRVVLNGRRISTAIAFKGKATKGILTPKKLGKNGDQIQRLFRSPAELFLIQYQGSIDQSVLEQMRALSIAKSFTEGVKIYFGIIDGQDCSRLFQAYSSCFK